MVVIRTVPLPQKVIEGTYFENLKHKVIDTGMCSHCGTCSAVCTSYSILENSNEPIHLSGDCVDCGLCVKVCPRWNYDGKGGIGQYLEIFSAKSKRFKGQDGGIVTELLVTALEEKIIDRAVVVDRTDDWQPKVIIATKADQVINAAGTKYSFAPVMSELRKAVFRSKVGVGFVGTPCMISGLRMLQKYVKSFRKVKLAVGIFCMENFYYNSLREFLANKGVDIKKVVWMGISKGKFIVKEREREVSFPVKELKSIIPSGCKVCKDFTAIESDVSVGSVGSPDGFSTVIVRTEDGKRVVEIVKNKGYVEVGEVQIKDVEKLCNLKMKSK